MDKNAPGMRGKDALNVIFNSNTGPSVSAIVVTTLQNKHASFDFQDALKIVTSTSEYNKTAGTIDAGCWSITVALMGWNAKNNEHECRGTVEILRAPTQRSDQQRVQTGTDAAMVQTPQCVQLCTYMDGSDTDLTVNVTNLWPVDYDRVSDAQQERRVAYKRVTGIDVKIELTAYMAERLQCVFNDGFNMIHWYMFAQCGTGIYSALHGQPSLGSFVGNVSTIVNWWNVAVEMACAFYLRDVPLEWSHFMLDAVGCGALALLVGPYTLVSDIFDSRNTKWASFFIQGDCDKDALTGGAIFTMLMNAMASVDDRAALERDLTGSAMAILVHWFKYRSKPIIMHVLAHPSTATGEAVDPDSTDPPKGHCVLGVLPKVYKDADDKYYVQYVTPQLRPVLRRFNSNFEHEADETDMTVIDNKEHVEHVEVDLEHAIKMGAIILGEMTVPTTPYSGVDHTHVAYTSVFRAFGFGPGIGGLLLFTPGHYVQGLQIYSQSQTVVVQPAANGIFPSVDEICATGAKTVTFDIDGITKLVRKPPLVLESIDLISDDGGRNIVDKIKALLKEHNNVRLMHKGAVANQPGVLRGLLTVGMSQYVAVLVDENGVLQCADISRGIASDLCRV
mgnify:FL=1